MAEKRRKGRGTKPLEDLSKAEILAKLNASAQRTLDSLQKAYEASLKGGFEEGEEDQVIELLRRAKAMRDKVRDMTREADTQPPDRGVLH